MSMPPLTAEAARALRRANWLRLLLGHRIVNGLSVGFGLALLTVPVFWLFGPVIAASASVGMLVTSIGDQTAPARGKLRQIAPLLFLAAPMSLAVQMAHLAPQHSTLIIGALVCIGGFVGMLGTAWGVRGGPLGFALLLTIIFAMSTPPPSEWEAVFEHALWFEFGALLYAAYAVLSAKVLNLRFRTLALADALNELATMLRQQGARLASTGDRRENQLRALLSEQAVLADKLQVARDLVLDVPKSPRELRLAGMLIAVIRLREQALACELEIDMQQTRSVPITLAQAQSLESLWREVGDQIDQVCWALFTVRRSLSLAAEPTVAVSDDADIPATLQATVQSMREETRSLWQLTASIGPESMRRSGRAGT